MMVFEMSQKFGVLDEQCEWNAIVTCHVNNMNGNVLRRCETCTFLLTFHSATP